MSIILLNAILMKIILILVGKTDMNFVKDGFVVYESRIKRYLPFETKVIPELKNAKSLSFQEQKEKEGNLILNQLQLSDFVVLLDEKGEHLTSLNFANFIQKTINSGFQKIVFVVGGPYGFSPSVYDRANYKLALSSMTFSHQIIRLIFAEQFYRAMTILKNEPYHHE